MNELNRSRRCMICANPDLNLIDGSSIWAQTITLGLAETGRLKIDFLAKSHPEREELFSPLALNPNIEIIDGAAKSLWSKRKGGRLKPSEMVEALKILDNQNSYDLIVIRGFQIAQLLTEEPDLLSRCWIYLTDISQKYELLTENDRITLTNLANGSMRILYQSDGFADLWKKVSPDITNKLAEYSPVIPDIETSLKPISARDKKVVYSGKFCKDWKTLEMANSWPEINKTEPEASLIMMGDLVRSERSDAGYRDRMLSALNDTKGLKWSGPLSRAEVLDELTEARVGLSWRSEKMDETIEYSTKILEYGGAGAAAILNRNDMHEKMLGKDYPLYANTQEEYIQKTLLSLSDDHVCQDAADRLHALALKHTFSSRVNKLSFWLENDFMKKTVLVAGHDLKFFGLLQKLLEETGRYRFLIDKWQGHNKHDESKSVELLKRADIIFCEWCLGNIKWYSEHKLPGQRLVARFHLQEKGLPYLGESDISAIDHISYVSNQIKREAEEIVAIPADKTSVIANLIDDKKFTLRKKMGDANFTLGVIGIAPRRKRVDLALDTLELLVKKDSRFQLRIKGTHPLDYSWLVNRPDELDYYMNIMRRINSSDELRYKVIFDPPGEDVDQWLTMIGFILSPSDYESFHLAVGEGMLTGAFPVVWNWPGSKEIWPENAIVQSAEIATEKILSAHDTNSSTEAILARNYVLENYGVEHIVSLWEEKLKC